MADSEIERFVNFSEHCREIRNKEEHDFVEDVKLFILNHPYIGTNPMIDKIRFDFPIGTLTCAVEINIAQS